MLAALLTPPGRGAIAVLHVAGPGARALVASLFGRPVEERPRFGRLVQDGEVLDEVVVRAVDGFTGEETVEISCHGGRAAVERIFRALAALGARRAAPEELLERGIETGALDRIRAEAWTLLPAARTELAARVLLDQAEGALSRAVAEVRDAAGARRLRETASLGLALVRPRRVVLAGRPNAGKSTLFNALLGRERAIVSPEPGTTRDPVRGIGAVAQVPLEFVDTAGVEAPRDAIEGMAIDRTWEALSEADLVVFLFDGESEGEEDRRLFGRLAGRKALAVVSKIDRAPGAPGPPGACRLSARTGEGLEELGRKILEALGIVPRHEPGAPVVFTSRQERLLGAAAEGRLDAAAAREALLRGPRG
ncbi:MAG TPA: GTPase [Planctomycetota bacterium]|nr:GTPase [Planctomycetota bacterium]